MTQPSNASRAQFTSLKTATQNAIGNLFEQELEAIREGRDDDADQLFQKRSELKAEVEEIRKAEIAYLLSEAPAAQAEAALKAAAARARKAVNDMTNTAKALAGAAVMINILTTLVGII